VGELADQGIDLAEREGGGGVPFEVAADEAVGGGAAVQGGGAGLVDAGEVLEAAVLILAGREHHAAYAQLAEQLPGLDRLPRPLADRHGEVGRKKGGDSAATEGPQPPPRCARECARDHPEPSHQGQASGPAAWVAPVPVVVLGRRGPGRGPAAGGRGVTGEACPFPSAFTDLVERRSRVIFYRT
jgi:hypothetical protein